MSSVFQDWKEPQEVITPYISKRSSFWLQPYWANLLVPLQKSNSTCEKWAVAHTQVITTPTDSNQRGSSILTQTHCSHNSRAISNVSSAFSGEQLDITTTYFSIVMKAHYRLRKGNPQYFLQASKINNLLKRAFQEPGKKNPTVFNTSYQVHLPWNKFLLQSRSSLIAAGLHLKIRSGDASSLVSRFINPVSCQKVMRVSKSECKQFWAGSLSRNSSTLPLRPINNSAQNHKEPK